MRLQVAVTGDTPVSGCDCNPLSLERVTGDTPWLHHGEKVNDD